MAITKKPIPTAPLAKKPIAPIAPVRPSAPIAAVAASIKPPGPIAAVAASIKPPAPAPPPSAALVAVNPKPSHSLYLEQDAGSGLEGMTKDDLAIPRLSILQALSPQVNKANESYLDGAEPGMIYESVTGELFDGGVGILVVMVSYRRAHNEWIVRQEGGGFVVDHGADPKILSETTRDKMNRSMLSNGHEIVPTAEYFAFLLNEEDWSITRVLISMTKSQIKKAKKINTLASSLIVATAKGPMQAPLFYRTFRLGTVPESNDRGSWFAWSIETDVNTLDIAEPFGEQIYLQARQFRLDINKGNVKVATPTPDDQSADSASTDHEGDDSPM